MSQTESKKKKGEDRHTQKIFQVMDRGQTIKNIHNSEDLPFLEIIGCTLMFQSLDLYQVQSQMFHIFLD